MFKSYVKKSACVLLALVLMITTLLTFSACGNKDDEIVEIEFWHKYSGDVHAENMTALIAEFEKQNPNIKVKELGLPFGDYNQKIETALASGSGPDLLIGDLDNTPRARAMKGQIMNIQEYAESAGLDTSVFFPATVEMCQYNGDLYALPFITDTRVLYWNKDHFREAGLDPETPPTTWAQVMEYNEILTKYNDNGEIERLGYSTNIGFFGEWTLGWTYGAELWNDDGTPNIDSPEMLQALKTAIAIQDQVGLDAFNAFNANSYANGYSPFVEETVSMSIDWNGTYSDIQLYNPDLDFGVALIPTSDGVNNKASWGSGFSLEIIDKNDDAKSEAAFKLAMFLCSTESAISFVKNCSDFVCNAEAYNDPEIKNDPVWALFAESGKYTRYHHFCPEYPTWHYSTLTPECQAAMLGTKTPEQALKDAEDWINQEIENYQKMHPNG